MKKSLLFACLLCGAFAFLTSCDEDEVAKKYKVTVTVTANDVDVDSLEGLTINCLSSSGNKMKVSQELDANFVTSYNLSAGSYTLSGSATYGKNKYIGETNFAVVNQDLAVTIELQNVGEIKSGIIFKELYFYGVPSYYFKDGFYELVNNSDEVQYLDGIIFSEIQRGYAADRATWEDSLGNKPVDFYPLDGYVMQFPGNGTDYPLQPGQSVVIATQAYNHGTVDSTNIDTTAVARTLTENDKPSPAGDLSTADWQLHIPAKAANGNYCNPNVKCMNVVWSNTTTSFWMLTVFGNPICLAKLPEQYATAEEFVNDSTNYHLNPSGKPILCIPTSCVIDAVDIQRSGESKIVKVFWPSEDAGYTYGTGADPDDPEYSTDFDSWTSPAYSGKSLRRKCILVANGRAYFQDTNNSTDDFILGGQTAVVRRQFTEPDK